MLDERKLTVLRAIVEDYVSTTEPVGSKSLVDRHHFDVSPATIRNDMAVLEEQGFIAQPHTSAGRIPTDKGYRLFVDRLSSVKPLSTAERRAIESFLAGAYSLDDVVMRTVRLLVQLTRQVAVVQYPSLTRSAIRHIELVPLAPTKLLVVLITDGAPNDSMKARSASMQLAQAGIEELAIGIQTSIHPHTVSERTHCIRLDAIDQLPRLITNLVFDRLFGVSQRRSYAA